MSFASKIWNWKSVKQAPHSEQATDNRMHCREILFTPRCSPRATEFPRPGQLFCTTYGCGATGCRSCPIFGFWPIFSIQNHVLFFFVTIIVHLKYIHLSLIVSFVPSPLRVKGTRQKELNGWALSYFSHRRGPAFLSLKSQAMTAKWLSAYM